MLVAGSVFTVDRTVDGFSFVGKAEVLAVASLMIMGVETYSVYRFFFVVARLISAENVVELASGR